MFTLHNGDCLEYMKTLPDKAFDCVITDPPYGVGYSYARLGLGQMEWDNAPASPEQIKEILRISKYQIIWGGNYFELPPTPCFLIWDKVQPEDFSSSMVEMAWTNFETSAKLYRRRVVGYKKVHPAMKPIELMRWCIENYTSQGETIFDPFMGSGTTGVACVEYGRDFTGCELSPEYFAIAEKRIKSAVLTPSFLTPSNNRLHHDGGYSPAQQALFTPEERPAPKGKATPARRR